MIFFFNYSKNIFTLQMLDMYKSRKRNITNIKYIYIYIVYSHKKNDDETRIYDLVMVQITIL